jgi:SAM-dependent methyltransferase
MTDYTYVGAELDLFAAATNWKSYLRRQVEPYLGRDVLEVGAGFGGTTRLLCRGDHDAWTCLEPDPALAGRLAESVGSGDLPACCRVEVGTLADLPGGAEYDTLLYIDVLEHIEDDAAEMARAAGHLKPGGHVVVLSPAHQWLFTPFDKAIGHYRRYTKGTLKAAAPSGLELVRLAYLDAVGLLASLGNKLVLNRSMPKPSQIAVWDRLMVPMSRALDPLLAHSVGKSVLGVWRRPPGGAAA